MSEKKLTKMIKFRLDDELDTLLSYKSKQANMSKSEFIRTLILDSKINCKKTKKDDYLPTLILHFAKIGNNLNQLALKLNIANKNDELGNYDYELLLDELVMINNHLTCIDEEIKELK